MRKIAISQSNYIPWKGYFNLINSVDVFVIYDDMQFTKRDWRNRNIIKTPQGLKWLTIPVFTKDRYFQKINETKISDKRWPIKHWKAITRSYSKAKNFKKYEKVFEELFLDCEEEYLSKINYKFITVINMILGIKTKIRFSSEFNLLDGKTEKLIGICKQCDANVYVSFPSAKAYFNEDLAKKEQIQVNWISHAGYQKYEQLYLPFEHKVTILDLIFNVNSLEFNKYIY